MVAFYELNDSYGDDLAQACVDFGAAIPGNDQDTWRLELSEGGAAQIEISSWQASGHSCSRANGGRRGSAAVLPGHRWLQAVAHGGVQVADPDRACKASMCGSERPEFSRSRQIDRAARQSQIR